MCIMIMKKTFGEAFMDTILDKITMAKKFFAKIEKRSAKNKNVGRQNRMLKDMVRSMICHSILSESL